MSELNILEFGKYKNKDIESVFKEDINYCKWLYTNPLTKNYTGVYDFLHSKFHNNNLIYLSFGKYRNRSVDWIIENDKNYIYYLRSNQYVQSKLPELANYVNKINI